MFFRSVDNPVSRQLDYLEVHQNLITPSASIDVELFHIPGEGLFAVFANSDPVSTRSRGVSGLYKWVEENFRLYQRLPSISAQCWCHFVIGENVSKFNFPYCNLFFDENISCEH